MGLADKWLRGKLTQILRQATELHPVLMKIEVSEGRR